jgi:hypothetical protein
MQNSIRDFDAADVFREGAENGTRGGCAPHQLRNSGFMIQKAAAMV